jgi:hypothetical protein
MVMQLRMIDNDVMDLGGRPIDSFDQRADLPTGLGPGCDIGRVAARNLVAVVMVSPRDSPERLRVECCEMKRSVIEPDCRSNQM